MPKPIEIPFPLGTAPGIRAQESAGRVINAYVEPLGPTAMAGRVWRRAPGLTNFGTSTHTGYRGAIEVNGTLYAAIGASMTKWTSAGGAGTDLTGTMTGTKRGFFARNNAVTPNIVFVDPDGSIALITAGSPGSISTTIPTSTCRRSIPCAGSTAIWCSPPGRASPTPPTSIRPRSMRCRSAPPTPSPTRSPAPWRSGGC
jgi:hypothetical protein